MEDSLQNLIPNFDYGSINEQHQAVIKEVAGLARSLGHTDFADMLIHRFKVVEPKKYKLDESKFYQACLANNVFCAVQGWVAIGSDVDSLHYPLIGMSEDIRKYEQLYEWIKNN